MRIRHENVGLRKRQDDDSEVITERPASLIGDTLDVNAQ